MKSLHILIIYNNRLPVSKYGGTQRVIWSLGKELAGMGHRITFLAGEGTTSDFAKVKILDSKQTLAGQIPEDVDLDELGKPRFDLERKYLHFLGKAA